MGFKVLAGFFGVLGTALIASVMNIWVKAKRDAFIALKYDQSRANNLIR